MANENFEKPTFPKVESKTEMTALAEEREKRLEEIEANEKRLEELTNGSSWKRHKEGVPLEEFSEEEAGEVNEVKKLIENTNGLRSSLGISRIDE